jgi:hypothetical protein
MPLNPYEAPKAPLDMAAVAPEVDPQIVNMIQMAWIAGLISVALTVILSVVSIVSGHSVRGIDGYALFDAAVMLGLTFGVYRKSRSCAVLLLAFFLLSKILMWIGAGNVNGLPFALAFMGAFAAGVLGTFKYHKALPASV